MANYDDTEDWKVKIHRKKEMKNLLEECDETYVVENSSLVKDTDEDVDSGISSFSGILTRKSMIWARDSIDKLPIKMTLGNIGAFALFFAILMPKTFTYVITYPIFRLVLGNLYPAYSSYKAVRTKNVKEYVKWMMYWIVFAIFTLVETFADILVSFWFPFYYEIKIIFLLWLLCPATKGSSIIYRRFLHPTLTEREAEIDEAIAKVTEQGYTAVLQLGSKGVNYATTVLMQTAIKLSQQQQNLVHGYKNRSPGWSSTSKDEDSWTSETSTSGGRK